MSTRTVRLDEETEQVLDQIVQMTGMSISAAFKNVLRKIREPLCTTVPVLTEAFHMLSPASFGANRLRDFVIEGGVQVWFMDRAGIQRAFFLMERYADHPMDLADASLVVAAEVLR